eukprot:g8534.t1
MDSRANAATPSKAGCEDTTGAAEISTPAPEFGTPAATTMMMDVSSPDPAPFSFARQKHPPAIASKPRSSRKVSSLFGSDATGEAAAGPHDTSAALKKGCVDGSGSVAPPGGLVGVGGDQAASPATKRYSSGGGSGGGGGFTSPVRASRELGTNSSRYTPQRNLGGLFASPLPPLPPTGHEEQEGGVTAPSPRDGLSAVVPLLLHSPKREEPAVPAPAPGVAVDEAASARSDNQTSVEKLPTSIAASASPAAATAAAPAPAEKAVTPSPVAALAAAAAPVARSGSPPACQCGCSSSLGASDSACGDVDVCCVSNEAFKDKDSKTMRTLEVVVKRERIGVGALASWRVAELKRRLVHLNLFSAAEAIALVPTFPLGGAALDDDIVLGTLDADVTYKARQVAVAAT